jgi:S-adenosylmethionine synthetase
MGRANQKITKTFNKGKSNEKTMEVELFTWERLDFVDKIKTAFGI